MFTLGSYNRMSVSRFVDFGCYLLLEEVEVLLPKRYMPENIEVGDEIVVFVYCDSEDRLVATTEEPLAVVDTFAVLTVKEVNRIGAFLDWGLPKDLLVPHSQMRRTLEAGQKAVVRVLADTVSNRIIGTTRLRSFFSTDLSAYTVGDCLQVCVYDIIDAGYLLIVDDEVQGMIPREAIPEQLKIGETFNAYVKKLLPDGRIDMSPVPASADAWDEMSEKFLSIIGSNDGFVNVNDKSSPEDIFNVFGVSKKTYKKIIGNLLKRGKVEFKDNGISLV